MTLTELNNWALSKVEGFTPNPAEVENRLNVNYTKNAFLNGWLTTAQDFLRESELSNKAIVYFAIREYVGIENEQAWLAFIKEFVDANE